MQSTGRGKERVTYKTKSAKRDFLGPEGHAGCGVEFCAACVSLPRREAEHSGACGHWGIEQITIIMGPSLHLETRGGNTFLKAVGRL